jgi:hypothetical protein
MTPTLLGRLQTRVFVTLVVGLPWTVLLSFVLPDVDRTAIVSIVITMGVIGLGWELLYHWLMGFRWEKDWPSLIALVTGVNEGILLGVLLSLGVVPGVEIGPPVWAFVVHFTTVWLLIWGWLQGPMKVVHPRWRFRGGRFV